MHYGRRCSFRSIDLEHVAKVILSKGWWRSTIIKAKNIVRVTPEIIQCDCVECDGTGFFMVLEPCVECKGTGRIYA